MPGSRKQQPTSRSKRNTKNIIARSLRNSYDYLFFKKGLIEEVLTQTTKSLNICNPPPKGLKDERIKKKRTLMVL
jgi:hypothetical protein